MPLARCSEGFLTAEAISLLLLMPLATERIRIYTVTSLLQNEMSTMPTMNKHIPEVLLFAQQAIVSARFVISRAFQFAGAQVCQHACWNTCTNANDTGRNTLSLSCKSSSLAYAHPSFNG